MEHKTASLSLQPDIILQTAGKKLPFNSTEIHKLSPNFHSPWNSPVSTIRMKMRLSLSLSPGEWSLILISKVRKEPYKQMEEGAASWESGLHPNLQN
jgi:hypothetical protein